MRPAILNEGFNANSCVATVRVTIDVLKYFGVLAKPVPVRVFILNAAAARIAEEQGMEELQRVVQVQEPSDVGGPWTLGLGHDDGTPGAGHVVVAIVQERTMLDLSLDQASRPLKNLKFEPLVATVDNPAWFTVAGEQVAYEIPQTDGNAALLYTHAEGHRYRQSPNWDRVSGGDTLVIPQLTSRLIRQIRADIA